MTWREFLLLLIAALFASSLVISISSMLALKVGDAIIAAWRWCRQRAGKPA